jgi:oxalate decarboxylase/phosphoglucose isomerase-like protein (cupin superfamily)
MKKTNPAISFRDKRGDIIDLISQEKINAVTLITFKKGAIRANHYHNKTTQWNYVLSGKIKFLTQMPKGRVVKTIAKKGDFVVTVPMERHSLAGMADSVILVLTKGPRGGKEYETDTFRLEEPLTEKR